MITCWRLNQRVTSGDAFRSFGPHLARWTCMTCWVGSWLCEMDGYELVPRRLLMSFQYVIYIYIKEKILNHLITSTSTSHATCWKDLYISYTSANTKKTLKQLENGWQKSCRAHSNHPSGAIYSSFCSEGGRCSDQKTWPWCHWILTSKKQLSMICTPEISFAILSKP